jgi:hypothetical protein
MLVLRLTVSLKGSIFYFGYLVGQYPAGYLLQRLPMAKFIGACTVGKPLYNIHSCL